jgi:hypothetical protein
MLSVWTLLTYQRVCNNSNTTGATCGVGTAYPMNQHPLPRCLLLWWYVYIMILCGKICSLLELGYLLINCKERNSNLKFMLGIYVITSWFDVGIRCFVISPGLSSFKTDQLICNKYTTTGAASGAWTAFPVRVPEFNTAFAWCSCCSIFSFLRPSVCRQILCRTITWVVFLRIF